MPSAKSAQMGGSGLLHLLWLNGDTIGSNYRDVNGAVPFPALVLFARFSRSRESGLLSGLHVSLSVVSLRRLHLGGVQRHSPIGDDGNVLWSGIAVATSTTIVRSSATPPSVMMSVPRGSFGVSGEMSGLSGGNFGGVQGSATESDTGGGGRDVMGDGGSGRVVRCRATVGACVADVTAGCGEGGEMGALGGGYFGGLQRDTIRAGDGEGTDVSLMAIIALVAGAGQRQCA